MPSEFSHSLNLFKYKYYNWWDDHAINHREVLAYKERESWYKKGIVYYNN